MGESGTVTTRSRRRLTYTVGAILAVLFGMLWPYAVVRAATPPQVVHVACYHGPFHGWAFTVRTDTAASMHLWDAAVDGPNGVIPAGTPGSAGSATTRSGPGRCSSAPTSWRCPAPPCAAPDITPPAARNDMGRWRPA
jgi:hypothetical protein